MIFSAQLSQICFYLVSCLICYWVMLVSKKNCMLLLRRWKIWSKWISKKSKTRLKIEKSQQADFRLLPETSLVNFPRFLILNHQCIKVHLNKWFFRPFSNQQQLKMRWSNSFIPIRIPNTWKIPVLASSTGGALNLNRRGQGSNPRSGLNFSALFKHISSHIFSLHQFDT